MSSHRRVRWTFALLVGLTVVAVGALSRALTLPASPTAAILVVVSSLFALITGGLALRILVALDRRQGDLTKTDHGAPLEIDERGGNRKRQHDSTARR